MTKNIMIVGVGGQGSLLASKLLGWLLLNEGYDVKVSEVHGMSQRGGSDYYTIQILLNQINENVQYLAKNASQMGLTGIGTLPTTTVRMAIAVVGILPVLVIYPFLQKYFVKGVLVGSVKE